MEEIAIIGPGRLGTAIALAAVKAGFRVNIGARHPKNAESFLSTAGQNLRIGPVCQKITGATIVFITVTDSQIESVCQRLVSERCLNPGVVIAHCSGALDSSVLESARTSIGARTASAHPLHSFTQESSLRSGLRNVYWFCEGESQALAQLEAFTKRMNSHFVRIGSQNKMLYHSAAVMVSNYSVVLMENALKLCEASGIDRALAWKALYGLVQSSLENIKAQGTRGALTGPIARGDSEIIRRHLSALHDFSRHIEAAYAALGKSALEISSATPERIKEMKTILEQVEGCTRDPI